MVTSSLLTSSVDSGALVTSSPLISSLDPLALITSSLVILSEDSGALITSSLVILSEDSGALSTSSLVILSEDSGALVTSLSAFISVPVFFSGTAPLLPDSSALSSFWFKNASARTVDLLVASDLISNLIFSAGLLGVSFSSGESSGLKGSYATLPVDMFSAPSLTGDVASLVVELIILGLLICVAVVAIEHLFLAHISTGLLLSDLFTLSGLFSASLSLPSLLESVNVARLEWNQKRRMFWSRNIVNLSRIFFMFLTIIK